MVKNISLCISLVVALASNYVNAACEKYGDGKSNCPVDSPCCYQGYCDSSAVFCILGNCRPGDSYSPNSCWPKPHCADTSASFNSASVLVGKRNFDGDVASQIWYSQDEPDYASVSGGNLVLGLKPNADLSATGQGSTVYFSRWVDHGTFTASIKSGCTQPGVVSSFIVRNEFGDEIDFEWVGLDTSNVQTNYYYNDELDYTKMVPSKPLGDTTSKFISYTIDWQPESVSWYADGSLIRTVQRADTWSVAEGIYKFPDREAQLSFSVWDGGNAPGKGTRDWAGSPTPYTPSTVYQMYVNSVNIKCLYSGNNTYVPKGQSSSSASSSATRSPSASTSASGSKSASSTPTKSATSSSPTSNSDVKSSADNTSSSGSTTATTQARSGSPSAAKYSFATGVLALVAFCFF